MNRMRSMAGGVWVLVAAAGLAMPALADDPKTGGSLGGPAVQDRNVPGVAGQFGEGMEGKKRGQAMRLPPQVFRDAMNAVMGDDAPADVRVSAEQREKFEGWFDEFQDSVRAYQREHRAEIQELRRKAGDQRGRRPGGADRGAPAQDPEMSADDKDAAAARDQLRQIMEGAPKIEDIHTKVWAELNEKQKAAVDEKLAVFRERQAQDREENYVRQKASKKANGAEQAREMERDRAAEDGQRPPRRPAADGAAPGRRPGGPGGPGAGGPEGQRGASNVSPERRDRVMRLLNRLTPEQQDQVIARLEERLRDAGLDGPQGGRRPEGRRGGPKPPPPMDGVNVPPPPPPEPMDDGKQS